MSEQPLPSYYNSLEASLEHALGLLSRGVKDRRSAFHTLTVATANADGSIEQRTVVNRGFDRTNRTLRFHTDTRAPKLAQLRDNPRASVHIYDARAKIQVRLAAVARVHLDTELHQTAWDATRPFSRECYRVVATPGTKVPSPEDLAFLAADDPDAGKNHFAAVTLQIHSLEWLYLAHQGHRRAKFAWDKEGQLSSSWLVP
ncbi:MAG: pyridoxamine 5'-phosphate oxidase family protein [Pseudomonadota bacterium]